MTDPPGHTPELLWQNRDAHLLPRESGKYEWVAATDPRFTQVHTLREVGSFGSDATENLIIHGDARQSLTAVARRSEPEHHYRGRVKLAYVDPPFNTGYQLSHYGDRLDDAVWLTLLRDCLHQVKMLLSQDGSVWLHLDDNEQHRARVVLDEVFGPENFVSTVIWDRTKNPRVTGKALSVRHDYIHVYRRGPSFQLRPLVSDRDGRPRYAHTIWSPDDVGSGREAMAESRALFGTPFVTPKPERLLARVIALASDPGDIVLDCFAGSGTTSAVAHKLRRRWVAVENREEIVCGFVQQRLARVVAGTDTGGITRTARWTGGGGFTRLDVEQP